MTSIEAANMHRLDKSSRMITGTLFVAKDDGDLQMVEIAGWRVGWIGLSLGWLGWVELLLRIQAQPLIVQCRRSCTLSRPGAREHRTIFFPGLVTYKGNPSPEGCPQAGAMITLLLLLLLTPSSSDLKRQKEEVITIPLTAPSLLPIPQTISPTQQKHKPFHQCLLRDQLLLVSIYHVRSIVSYSSQ